MLIKTGHCLDDIGRSLSWGALGAFLRHIDINSELARELDPELAAWGTTAKTNALLADLYDVVALLNSNLVAMGSGKNAKKPKPYKRPGDKDKQKIGKNALPPDQLREWLADKRRKHNEEVNRQ